MSVHTGTAWRDGLQVLVAVDPSLADRVQAAAAAVKAELANIGADQLPLTVIHGDFTQWNVHYDGARRAGVIDFDLTHLDSRPYELAIARSYRAPAMRVSYRQALDAAGWPLSDLELHAIDPLDRAFRIGMIASELDHAYRTGTAHTDVIERQLEFIGTHA